MDNTLFVCQVDIVRTIDLRLLREFGPYVRQLRFVQSETGVQGPATGPLEADPRRLVPDDEVSAEQSVEHHHEDGVDRAIEAATEGRAEIAARRPVQRQLDPDFALILGDIGYPGPGPAIAGEQVLNDSAMVLQRP